MVDVSPATVGHGGTITISLSGDCLQDTFFIVVHSSERTLGSITTDAAGNGSAPFALPCAVNVGRHIVTAADGIGNTGSAPLRVSPAPCQSAPGHGKHGGHNGGGPPRKHDLRVAGVEAQAGVPVGAAAVGASGLLILGLRNRRRSHF
jgi:hypothetical protein